MISPCDQPRKDTLFSIVTVAMNNLDGLKLTAASLKAQTFREFEWIIIDGDSTDGTDQFLSQLDHDKVKWISESDHGIYEAMNKGIKFSSGQYLLFLNAGDFFPIPSVLQKVSEHIKTQNGGVDVLFGGANFVFPNRRKIYRPPYKIDKYIWHGLPANHQATYYKRIHLRELAYDTKYRICGDYYIAAMLYNKGVNVSYLHAPVVDFRVGGNSYRYLGRLFLEPYLIQRDILGLPLGVRVRSLVKRFISTSAMHLLTLRR